MVSISKTKIKKHLKRKTNPLTLEVIELARKQKSWLPIAKIVASSTRNYSSLNLEEINKNSIAGETIVIPGKVLGTGEITKKIKLVAISFSEAALKNLKNSKTEYSTLNEEIKRNPEAKGVKILK